MSFELEGDDAPASLEPSGKRCELGSVAEGAVKENEREVRRFVRHARVVVNVACVLPAAVTNRPPRDRLEFVVDAIAVFW